MNTQDVLNYGHRTMLGTLEGVPQTEWETGGVCGVWSVKDIIAHLTSHNLLLAEVMTSTFLGRDDPTPCMAMIAEIGAGEFNDAQVALRQAMTPAEMLAEHKEAHAQVMALIVQIPPEKYRENGTMPWYGADYDLDDFIVYTSYAHKREHCAEINVFRDRLAQG